MRRVLPRWWSLRQVGVMRVGPQAPGWGCLGAHGCVYPACGVRFSACKLPACLPASCGGLPACCFGWCGELAAMAGGGSPGGGGWGGGKGDQEGKVWGQERSGLVKDNRVAGGW